MKSKILGLVAVVLLAVSGSGHATAVLEQIAPGAVSYVEGTDFLVLSYAAPGNVTAQVQAVDLQLGLGNLSTSGCEAADFAGFVPGAIALIQRGNCTFEVKAENAAAAGASGVLIFNQGDTAFPSRQDLFDGTLMASYTGGLSVFSLSYALGAQFAATPGLVMHMYFDGIFPVATPEPGTLALLCLGLAGLGLSRRRKLT